MEDPLPGFLCQGYVLISGLPAFAAREAMQGTTRPICFEGTLGNWSMTQQLYCLDLRTVEDLPAELPGGDSIIWTVMPWFSSVQIASLRLAE